MNRAGIALLLVLCARLAGGQGFVLFANRVPGVVDARVSFQAGYGWAPANSRFVAQLYAAPAGGTLKPFGEPVIFNESPGSFPDPIHPRI